MGHVPDPAAIMSAVDVLVIPSDKESFGRVAVEAMAASVPVVGTRGGGVAEIVLDGETGLLAAPDDAAALADRIAALVADPARRARLGAAGRVRAENEFSLEASGARMLAVYEAAMRRPLHRFSYRALT
jgi:glycosyltransferase involved in cell wall biosynthesis